MSVRASTAFHQAGARGQTLDFRAVILEILTGCARARCLFPVPAGRIFIRAVETTLPGKTEP